MKNYSMYEFGTAYQEKIKNNQFKIGDTVWTMIAENQELDFAGAKLTRKKYIAVEATIIAMELGQSTYRGEEYFDLDADHYLPYRDEYLEPQIFADIIYAVDGNSKIQKHCPIDALYLRQEDVAKEIAYENQCEEVRLKKDYPDVLFDAREVGILIKLNSNISMEKDEGSDGPCIYKTARELAETIDDMLWDFCNSNVTEGQLEDYGTYKIFLNNKQTK